MVSQSIIQEDSSIEQSKENSRPGLLQEEIPAVLLALNKSRKLGVEFNFLFEFCLF